MLAIKIHLVMRVCSKNKQRHYQVRPDNQYNLLHFVEQFKHIFMISIILSSDCITKTLAENWLQKC